MYRVTLTDQAWRERLWRIKSWGVHDLETGVEGLESRSHGPWHLKGRDQGRAAVPTAL